MTQRNKIAGISAYLLPSLGEVLFLAIFFVIIGFGPEMMNVDGDLGRHLTLGNYILESKSIPTADIFSFTKYGDPLTPHEWLADVLFSLFYRVGSLDGVVWITALVLATSYWMVYRHSVNISGLPLLALLGTLLAGAASSLHWLTRPHIFTILFTAIWTVELEKIRLGIRQRWFRLPVLMLIWVNLHGAFFAGIVIWMAYFGGSLLEKKSTRDTTRMLWIGISSLLVTGANPDGFGIWRTGLGFLGNQYLVSHTAEYLPPNFQDASTWPFLLLILVSLIVLGIGKRRQPVSHVFLIAGWTVMALYSARNIPLYGVVVTPILVAEIGIIFKALQNNQLIRKINNFQLRLMDINLMLRCGFWAFLVPLTIGLLLLNGYQLDFDQQGNIFLDEVFPVQAVDWMENNMPEGNGFNYFPWGGYLLYRLWPDNLVFIDGQTDFYGENLTRQYEHVLTLSEGWEDVLDDYNVEWILIPTDNPMTTALDLHSDWGRLYQDSTAVLYANK